MDRYVATVTSNLGSIVAHLGEPDRATDLYEEALRLATDAGDVGTRALVLQNLGHHFLHLNRDLALATERLRESLDLFVSLGDRSRAASSLAGLAGAAVRFGDPLLAARLHGAAGAIRQSIGERLDPHMAALEEIIVTEVRNALGREAFDRAREAGALLTWDEAVREAMSFSPGT